MVEKEGKANSVNKSKKSFRLFLVFLFVVVLILAIVTFIYYTEKKSSGNTQGLNQIVLENPMKKIVESNTNSGQTNEVAVVQQGIKEFNQDFINYILLALGVNNLHSFIGFGNPVVELSLDGEIWSSEIINGGLSTARVSNNNKDLRFTLSKEEAIRALLSSDLGQFMKDSVVSGRTQIEMIADNSELLAKGYLDMYNNLKN